MSSTSLERSKKVFTNDYISIINFLKMIYEVLINSYKVNYFSINFLLVLIATYFIYLVIDFKRYQRTGKSIHLQIINRLKN